ncbi:MAG: hypothetical protein AAGI15_10120 [Pseudomonadota bacterium]
MPLKPHQQTALWLIVSAALLSSLIPGGPIENRDFSHIHPGILIAFNLFLTTLDIGSIVLAWFAVRQRQWALQGAFYAAIAYFAVYAVDLAQLFPRSETPMSFALALVEVLGMSAAVPLMFASRNARAVLSGAEVSTGSATGGARYAVAVAFVALGLVVIWFATDAAMSGGPSATDPSVRTVQ